MNNRFKLIVFSLIILFFPFFSVISQVGVDTLLPGIEFFLSGEPGAAEGFFNNLEPSLSSARTPSERLNYGRMKLWQSRIALLAEDEVLAEELLNEATAVGKVVEEATAGGAENRSEPGKILAEAYRLQADALGEIMLFKGVPYIIRNGGRVQELTEQAIEVDGENPDALILHAQGRINAPRIFGGNRKEGLAILDNLWRRRPGGPGGEGDNLNGPQTFRTALALGNAWAKKDPEMADGFYREADRLYPGNPYTDLP